MDRLTKRLPDGKAVMDCDSCKQKKDKQCTFYECRASLIKRLAAYEDTGLTPEAVETVKLALAAKHLVDLETFNNTPISRLVELAEADKDGRVIVLPAKKGDTWKKAMSILDKKYAEAKKLPFIRDPLAWALYHTWKEFDDGKRCD